MSRPKGSPKTGGRKKGTPNKVTVEQRRKLKELIASGKDPITFFTDILREPRYGHLERKEAAKELLPYFHPKLASIEARTGGMTHEDRLEKLQAMARDDDEGDE